MTTFLQSQRHLTSYTSGHQNIIRDMVLLFCVLPSCCLGLFSAQAAAQGTMQREYARLIDHLLTGDHFEQEKAVDVLAELDPENIKDANLRKQIARGFKTLAQESHPPDDVYKGLVNWGGKHSIPVLLELLAKDRFGNAELMNAIAKFDDPRCASALAERLGDFHTGQEAKSALRRMRGSAVEEALIQVAPSNDEDVCVAALSLLADIGTSQAMPVLNKAAKSRNVRVRELAVNARSRIRARASGKEVPQESMDSQDSPFSESGADDRIAAAARTRLSDTKTADEYSGDWSDVVPVIGGQPAGAGVPPDPPGNVVDFQPKPIGLQVKSHGFFDGPTAVAMAEAERPLAVVVHSVSDGALGKLELLDLIRGRSIAEAPAPGGTISAYLAPACTRLLTIATEGMHRDSYRLTTWRLDGKSISEGKTWMPYAGIDDHWKKQITGAVWLDDEHFMTLSGKGQLVKWHADDAKAIYQLTSGRGGIPAISPGRKYIAVGGTKSVALHRAEDGRLLATLDWPGGFGGQLAFDKKGERLAAQNHRQIWLWNLADGKLIQEIYCHNLGHGSLRWLADNLIMVGDDVVDLRRHLIAWRYKSPHNSPPYSFANSQWYLLASGPTRGLVPYQLPHDKVATRLDELNEEQLFALKPNDTVSLDVRLGGELGSESKSFLTDALKERGFQIADDAQLKFVVETTTEQEQANYVRWNESLFSEGTKVTTSKNLYKVTLNVDDKPAWVFVSTQSAPMHLELAEGESIQQGMDRKTQKSSHYFRWVRFPTHVVHPDYAGPLGESVITVNGLR